MTEVDDFEIQEIDANDELLEPMRQFQSAQYQKEQAMEQLYTFFYSKNITNRFVFVNNKPYIWFI